MNDIIITRDLEYYTFQEITLNLLLTGILTVPEVINKRIELRSKLIGVFNNN